MAERNFDFAETLGRKKRFISGSFATLSGNGTILNVKGLGFTVATKAATGTYVVTFTDGYPSLQCALVSLQQPAAADNAVIASSYDSSARTLTIITQNSSGAVDPADNAASRVNFLCVFDDALTV
ncbi:MAG: hypothetical protein KGL39_47455 [Patescibacteria group bacterium]|nr:hypothetical protein [Patescibacteria group bacterium]